MYIDKVINRQGIVTGIIYAGNESSAIVSGQILRNGDILDGVTVFKVNQFSVEFEKNGIQWSQRVQEKPSREWRISNSAQKTSTDVAAAASP